MTVLKDISAIACQRACEEIDIERTAYVLNGMVPFEVHLEWLDESTYYIMTVTFNEDRHLFIILPTKRDVEADIRPMDFGKVSLYIRMLATHYGVE